MTKKKVKKKSSKKKSRKSKNLGKTQKPEKTIKDFRVERILVDNFVALQKVMTNLSIKFDHLSERIDKLLDLFEVSAKTLAEKDFKIEKENINTEKITKQMDTLLNQNKIIARGMTLINDKILEQNDNRAPQIPLRVPRPMIQNPQVQKEIGIQGYQKSISFKQGNNPPKPVR